MIRIDSNIFGGKQLCQTVMQLQEQQLWWRAAGSHSYEVATIATFVVTCCVELSSSYSTATTALELLCASVGKLKQQ